MYLSHRAIPFTDSKKKILKNGEELTQSILESCLAFIYTMMKHNLHMSNENGAVVQ